MDNTEITLIHRPFGNEQPYFQQPFERFPRMVRPAVPISVGLTVHPAHVAQTVLVRYSIESLKDRLAAVTGCAEAICIGNSDSVGNSGVERHWMAQLPPLPDQTSMTYTFDVDTGDGHVYDGPYTCSSGLETRGERVVSWEDCGAYGVILSLGGSSNTEQGTLEMQILRTPGGPSFIVAPRISRSGEVSIQPIDSRSKTLPTCPWRISQSRGALVLDAPGEEEGTHKSTCLFCESVDAPREEEETACTVSIELGTGRTVIADHAGLVCASSQGGPSLLVSEGPGGSTMHEITWCFDAPEGEKYLGFGERYTDLDHRGSILHNRVFEQYKNQRLRTYIPIPFFFTNQNWALHIDTLRDIEYDMASRDSHTWRARCEADLQRGIRFDFLLGRPAQVCTRFANRFAKPDLPPAWVFGPWMSSNEWNTQRRVQDVACTTRDLDIPATVLVIEAWSDETTFFIWNDSVCTCTDPAATPRLADFSFSAEGHWPDPKTMVANITDQGLHVVLWQIPVVKEIGSQEHVLHRANEEHVQSHGYVLTKADGTPYQVTPGWFHGSMVLDFDNPEARNWWFSRRRYLLEEMGIAGFKTDGGEHIWGYTVSGAGGNGEQIINTFPQSYIDAYTEELRSTLGAGKGILFSRSGYTGARATPAHWSGDQDSTWETYRSVVKAMIHASICGIPFMGWDIGGFTGDFPTAELYLRSAAAATFSPIMQYHSEFNNHRTPCADRTPWNVQERTGDELVVPVYRMLAHLRMALVPYLQQESRHAIETGVPLVQPLCLTAPDDERCWDISDEYMLGRSLLVAPVLDKAVASRTLYLPAGVWEDFWTGERIAGGCTIEVSAPLERIPVYLLEDDRLPGIPEMQQVRGIITRYSP